MAAAGVAASGAEALTLRRRVRDITIPTLPTTLEGLTILHISDVHAGYGPGLTLLRRGARWAAELEPDIIAVTGDLVARRSAGPGFAAACAELVSAARLAAVAVLGNHDLAEGRDPFAQGWDAGDLGGVTLLDGAAIELAVGGRRISLAGASAARMMRKTGYDPVSHLDPSADLRVLLCHFPHMLPRLEPGIAAARARGSSARRPDLRALAGRPHRPGPSALGPDLCSRGLQRHGHARLARPRHDVRAAEVLRAARGHAAAAARGLSP